MKNFEDELLRQISLMRYDRGKILSEQDIPKYDDMPLPEPLPSDQLGKYGDFQPLKNMANWVKSVDDQAKLIYNKIVEEIDGGWAPWKWGTDEDGLTSALMSIKTKQVYDKVKQLLATKYPDSKNQSITEFIQSKEFSTAFSSTKSPFVDQGILGMSVTTPLDLLFAGQNWQYNTNDKYLIQIQNHLIQFNPDEKINTIEKLTAMNLVLPPAASEALHVALPVLSLAFSFFPPAAIVIELMDAGLYYAEGDAYSAGLGLAFALVPGGAFGALSKKLGKNGQIQLMKKVSKDAAGQLVEGYTKTEKEILKSISESTFKKSLQGSLAKGALLLAVKSASTIKEMFKIVWWLVKNGYLKTKFLSSTGLQIAGVFYTWDFIASVLGICNSMPLKKFSASEEGYLRAVGGAASFLQQFSSECDKQRATGYLQNKLSETSLTTKERVIKYLNDIVDANGTLILRNLTYANIKSLNTTAVQVALRALGMDKYNYTTLVPGKNEKTFVEKPYDPNDPYIKFMKGLGNSEESLKQMWKIKQQSDKKEVEKSNRVRYDDPVTGRVFYFDSYDDYAAATKNKLNFGREVGDYGQVNYIQNVKTELYTANFTWGYYNEDTKKIVEEFQRKNNLSVDGEVGPNTAKKLIEKVNALSTVSDYQTGIDKLTDSEIKKMIEDVKKQIADEMKSNLTKEMLNQAPTQEQIKEVEKNTEENLTNEVEKVNDPKRFDKVNIFSDFDSENDID